ncbi:hypothetical protein BpHYR1_009655 [Brachionus plicatilis]|uniref:Secreted protein n=1 Tax=Brachionus plicatilis TaxID=10195 RepID=A0A3M7PR03_BRAPC|nr:hypothetical protein BpHYR1_009655 [Brachionus plicatilis]
MASKIIFLFLYLANIINSLQSLTVISFATSLSESSYLCFFWQKRHGYILGPFFVLSKCSPQTLKPQSSTSVKLDCLQLSHKI